MPISEPVDVAVPVDESFEDRRVMPYQVFEGRDSVASR
jgi:hypothetical protein